MGTLHLINTRRMAEDDFVSTLPPADPQPSRWPFNPPEAASACSEFGHDEPPPRPQTVSLLRRIKRKLRALAIKRMKP